MADTRFFVNRGPFALGALAERCGARLAADADPARLIHDVAPLDKADAGELSFFDNPLYAEAFRRSRAGALIVAPKNAARAAPGATLLLSEQPYRAYALAAQAFYPSARPEAGIHPRASIDATAKLGQNVAVDAGAVIAAGAEIGSGSAIGANATVGRNVKIGEDCRIGALVSLSHCEIGDRVTLHPGVRVGQDGFGFAPDPRGHVKVPQLGRVIVGSDCDIGANTCIDRGAGPDTVIGPGCWIDNLVQIGHNVVLGRGCIIVGQAGIAGSTRLGDFVAMGAQSGIAGHLTIGGGARIAAQSGVMKNMPAGETWFGMPAGPMRRYLREVALLRRLARKTRD